MTLTTFSLNGTPLEELGLATVRPADATGLRTVTAAARRTVVLPGVPGQVDLGDTPQYAPRVIPLRLLAEPASLAERVQVLDDLAARFAGPVEIRTVEDEARVCVGRLESMAVSELPNFQLIAAQPAFYGDCQLVCDDPMWYDAEPLVIALTASGVAATLPAGTASTRRLRFRIMGATTPTTVTAILRDLTAAELSRMTFSTGTALGATEYLDVDCEAMTIQRVTAGTAADQRGYLGASEGYFVVPAAVDSTLELSVTSGTVTGVAYLTRAYRS